MTIFPSKIWKQQSLKEGGTASNGIVTFAHKWRAKSSSTLERESDDVTPV